MESADEYVAFTHRSSPSSDRRDGTPYLTLALTFVAGAAVGLTAANLRSDTSPPSWASPPTNSLAVAPAGGARDPAHKYAVEGVTPVALQMARGTCWVFAAVAVLEHSYRMQGIARGLLGPTEYLRLSEQVFGIAVLDACAALSTESCLIGDEVWVGNQLQPIDTQGGFATMLYYLRQLETSAALPHSVCAYTEDVGQDHTCPGLREAMRTSPLKFETRSISTLFDRADIQAALRRDQRVMSLSTGMVQITYLLPCTRETAAALQCDPDDADACVPCPLEPTFGGVACCVITERESNTMHGEFFRLPPISHPSPLLEGGHAMALVGYNDLYRTQHGFVGGWIVRNSWWDGLPPSDAWTHARGSHSLGWFMQTISRQDEDATCPNAHAPSSWYACGSLATCRSRQTSLFANSMKRPLHLECLDKSPFVKGLCEAGDKFFLEGLHPWGAGLTVGCFLRDEGATPAPKKDEDHGVVQRTRGRAGEKLRAGFEGGFRGPAWVDAGGGSGGGGDGASSSSSSSASKRQARVCSPPVPVDDLALVFAPVETERWPNHPQLCGFYFFPYELAEQIHAAGQGFFEVDDMEVIWDDSSYAANADKYPQFDYGLMKADTHTQERARTTRPFVRGEEAGETA